MSLKSLNRFIKIPCLTLEVLCVVVFWSGISAKGLDLKGLVQLALALEERYGLALKR